MMLQQVPVARWRRRTVDAAKFSQSNRNVNVGTGGCIWFRDELKAITKVEAMNLETMRAGYRRIRRPVATGADADVDNGGCADRGGRRLNLMRDE